MAAAAAFAAAAAAADDSAAFDAVTGTTAVGRLFLLFYFRRLVSVWLLSIFSPIFFFQRGEEREERKDEREIEIEIEMDRKIDG